MDNQDINTLITRSEAICAHINTAVAKEAYAAAVPDGWRIENLETLRPQRQYPRGKYRTTHWGDFIAYGKARQGEGAEEDSPLRRIARQGHPPQGRDHGRSLHRAGGG